jgi:hypothetical protein
VKVSTRITKCLWCQVPICLFGNDVLWTGLDASYEGPLLECSESMLFPPVHLPVGRDGWFPSPRYRGIRWG